MSSDRVNGRTMPLVIDQRLCLVCSRPATSSGSLACLGDTGVSDRERATTGATDDLRPPSGWQLEAEMSRALQLLAALPDDERLRRDTIEGETRVFEYLDAIADEVLADEALVDKGRERLKRLEARAERNRKLISDILQVLRLR